MKFPRTGKLLLLLGVIGMFACGRFGAGTPTSVPPANEPAASGNHPGASSGWPETIPADIPILEGQIETVMEAPGTRIRIFYSSVSAQQVTDYLAQLESQGFHLEYICYVEEGFPDTCEEQQARGEYDAVDITKGVYRMRLEPGGGQATYDIYTAGFMTPDPSTLITATPLVWPADIPAQVPIPASCELHAMAILSSPGYQITFTCQDVDVQAKYIETLLAAGLVETDRLVSDTGEIVQITLENKEVKVNVGGVIMPYITIQVWFK